MKADIHPEYHKVLFVDVSSGDEWMSMSTKDSEEKREIDGEQIPVIKLEISSASHPFWTGTYREVDTAGRIERFRRRYGKRSRIGKGKAEEAQDEAPQVEAAPEESAS